MSETLEMTSVEVIVEEAKKKLLHYRSCFTYGDAISFSCGSFFAKDTDVKHLLWMCDQVTTNMNIWTVEKLFAWAGYIQGCMVCHGISDWKAENSFFEG
jgi:hypothetical protein